MPLQRCFSAVAVTPLQWPIELASMLVSRAGSAFTDDGPGSRIDVVDLAAREAGYRLVDEECQEVVHLSLNRSVQPVGRLPSRWTAR
jgi:hypothetical protein